MSILFYICSNKIDKMKNTLLLPNKYKVIGWVTSLSFAALGLACMYCEFKIPGLQLYYAENEALLDFADYNLTNELALTGIALGLLMVAFAQEKTEDEYVSHLRLKSWQWSVLVSYAVTFLIIFTFYGFNFLSGLIHNIYTVLIVFIIKFNWSLYKFRKEGLENEK